MISSRRMKILGFVLKFVHDSRSRLPSTPSTEKNGGLASSPILKQSFQPLHQTIITITTAHFPHLHIRKFARSGSPVNPNQIRQKTRLARPGLDSLIATVIRALIGPMIGAQLYPGWPPDCC